MTVDSVRPHLCWEADIVSMEKEEGQNVPSLKGKRYFAHIQFTIENTDYVLCEYFSQRGRWLVVSLFGLCTLLAAIVISYLLYFKYVIGQTLESDHYNILECSPLTQV